MTNKQLQIIKQLKKYDITSTFPSQEDLDKWVSNLNELEINNILSLNIDSKNIKFSKELLIDKNLLNTSDYIKRVEALVSIKNAEGWYHLFDRMLRPEFLYSNKFYSDIETLKKAECAQTPLWIIGEPEFINSPYHDEDFELLVTAKDTSGKQFDYVVWDAIATIAGNADSIKSEYHRQDLQTIVKYGAKSLQLSHSYPESCINYLAINPISLKDQYHLENMEILAQNTEIGNFLYAIMTDSKTIKSLNYRRIINEMVENKENMHYVFLVCYYALGQKAVDAQNIVHYNYYYDLKYYHNLKELLKQVEEKLNIIDSDYKDVTVYEIEDQDKQKSLIKRIFSKK